MSKRQWGLWVTALSPHMLFLVGSQEITLTKKPMALKMREGRKRNMAKASLKAHIPETCSAGLSLGEADAPLHCERWCRLVSVADGLQSALQERQSTEPGQIHTLCAVCRTLPHTYTCCFIFTVLLWSTDNLLHEGTELGNTVSPRHRQYVLELWSQPFGSKASSFQCA